MIRRSHRGDVAADDQEIGQADLRRCPRHGLEAVVDVHEVGEFHRAEPD
jgi:hypothetical protein